MTTMNKTELKQAVTKIKKFLKQRDYEAINTGIELARGLNDPAVFEALLGGWSINGEGTLEFDSDFKGEPLTKKWSDKTWPYFSYALLNLICRAQESANLDASLKRPTIHLLNLSRTGWTRLPPCMAELHALTRLELGKLGTLQDVEVLRDLPQLSSLNLQGCHSLFVPPRDLGMDSRESVAEYQDKIRLYRAVMDYDTKALAQFHDTVELDLSGCPIQHLDVFEELPHCTHLKLRSCASLECVYGLQHCAQLAHLDLRGCKSLATLDALSACARLTGLDLSGCALLTSLDPLASCTRLSSLDLSGCSSLTSLDGLSVWTELTSLNLSGCDILTNTDALASCTQLSHLDLSGCESLENLDGLAACTKLTCLDLSGCESLKNVDGVVNCTQLASLTCHGPALWQPAHLPARSVGPVTAPNSTMTSRAEVAAYQDKIRIFMALRDGASLADFKDITSLDLCGCNSLADVNGLAACTQLNDLNLNGCSSLEDLDALTNCTQLTSLNLRGCSSLGNLDGLAHCTQLTSLDPSYCESLENLDGLTDCTQLTSLDLSGCESLKNVDGLAKLTQITALHFSECKSLQNVDGLAGLTQLTSLKWGWSHRGPVAHPDHTLTTRTEIAAYQDKVRIQMALRDGDSLAEFKDITSLDLGGCDSLKNIDGLTILTQLTSLDLNGCDSLQNVDGLANCTQLTSLNLSSCDALQNVDGLANCTQLTSLNLSSCDALQEVDGLATCTQLTSLDLSYCESLQNVDALANWTQLSSLSMGACPQVRPKPSPVKMGNQVQVSLYQVKVMRRVGLEVPASLSDLAQSKKKPTPKRPKGAKKTQFTKIRKFLKQRDFGAIHTGIELARSLDDPEIFEALLGGWRIYKGPDPEPYWSHSIRADNPLNGALLFSEDFGGETLTRKWANNTRPYFMYALVNLMAYAPEGTKMDSSIERPNVTDLALNTLFWPALPPCLSEFKNLAYLDLRSWIATNNGNYDFSCWGNKSFDWRNKCKIEDLDTVSTLAPGAKVLLP